MEDPRVSPAGGCEQRRPACGNAEFELPRPRRLKVVTDLELVCDGRTPQAGSASTADTHHPPTMPPTHGARPHLVYESKYKSGWGYRVSKSDNIQLLKDRFSTAYQVVRSAELEVCGYLAHWDDDNALEALWTAPWEPQKRVATLAHWFGDFHSRWLRSRLATVAGVLRRWSACFRHGFYGFHKPVFIELHPNTGSNLGYHAAPNVVTLLRPWFDIEKKYNHFALVEAEQVFTVIHEMGHYSGAGGVTYFPDLPFDAWAGLLAPPSDRRNAVCGGRCYQAGVGDKGMYNGSAPRWLVEEFEKGKNSAGEDMLANIDNYVSYMWNRWQHRNYGEFKF